MLTDQGEAQKRRCFAPCEHWRTCAAERDRRGADYADFCAYQGQDPGVWLNLTHEVWDGPASGCPAGYWDGLAPVDTAAEMAAGETRAAEGLAARLAPVAARLIQRDIPLSTLQSRLEKAVADGLIGADAAARLEQKVRDALGI